MNFIIPCFIALTMNDFPHTKTAMINARSIESIHIHSKTSTILQINGHKYSVTEKPIEIKNKIKQECGK